VTAVPDERTSLTAYLQAQRCSVLAIIDGLPECDMRRSVVGTGWTPAGMIEHLGDAEGLWMQRVVAGIGGETAERPESDMPEPEVANEGVAFATERDLAEIITWYRQQVEHSTAILADVQLDSRPAGPIPGDMTDTIHSVRDVVLHLIEETARHAGHLDIARELLDGRTGLGPR
jgi:uncharacterized damage-inducible protein DinB